MNRCILIILMIFASFNLQAIEPQSIEEIQSSIEKMVLEQAQQSTDGTIKVTVGRIDPRLNLRQCTQEHLQIFNPYDTPVLNTTTMGAKCLDDNNHWTLYIPIKISILKPIIVTKKALQRGSQLTQDSLYVAEMDAQKLKQGFFTNPSELVGLVLKKDVASGSVLTPYDLELAKLVTRGQEVTINVISGKLKISMGGIALNDGAMGDTVQVKNKSSNKVIEGQVSGNKQVKVAI